MTARHQPCTQYARLYADIKADLLATEGRKVIEFRRDRAARRSVADQPTKQQRHRAESNQHHQQGAL